MIKKFVIFPLALMITLSGCGKSGDPMPGLYVESIDAGNYTINGVPFTGGSTYNVFNTTTNGLVPAPGEETPGNYTILANGTWQPLPINGAGTEGPPGDQGIPGIPGQGFTWRGAWISGTAYASYDTVTSGGSSFVCILETSGTTIPVLDNTHWSIMVSNVFSTRYQFEGGTILTITSPSYTLS